eukprot:CAMPEP_0185366916 /NCGR_PEP_ID=MMETSP1364-20130426/14034_1 /TAXON_ID=38817 /ORGANISM="Gephyrocapsa oceanica, Strain RCC1303" /LENGTH=114 /DNA_ID=CAMNT_0027967523 /DNA_START=408 /DNA_END=753 /DNA_ORIENTATION=-
MGPYGGALQGPSLQYLDVVLEAGMLRAGRSQAFARRLLAQVPGAAAVARGQHADPLRLGHLRPDEALLLATTQAGYGRRLPVGLGRAAAARGGDDQRDVGPEGVLVESSRQRES